MSCILMGHIKQYKSFMEAFTFFVEFQRNYRAIRHLTIRNV